MSESRICIALDFQTKDEVKAFLDKFEDEKLYVYVSQEKELAAFTEFFMNQYATK